MGEIISFHNSTSAGLGRFATSRIIRSASSLCERTCCEPEMERDNDWHRKENTLSSNVACGGVQRCVRDNILKTIYTHSIEEAM